MRSFVSVVSGVVALVALLAAVPLLWVSTHVADREGYVAFSSRLAEDDELQEAFSAYLADELVSRGVLPSSLRSTATSALTLVAGRTADEPGFVEAWEETQRRFHTSVFADPTPRTLSLDVGPMATFVTDRVSARLPVSLRVPDDLVVPVAAGEKEREAVAQVERTRSLGWLAAAVAVAAAAVSVGASRRRPLAFVGLGLGAVVVAGVLRASTGPAAQKVLDETPAPSEFARTLQKLLVDRASDSLSGWLVVVAVVGAVAAVGGVVGRVATRSR